MKKIIILTTIILLIPLFITTFITSLEEPLNFIFSNKIKVTAKTVRIKDELTGEINELNFEEYIKGVVAAEMPASFHIEALKAQAIASRSYAMRKINENSTLDYDLVISTNHQVYNDEEELREKWGDNYLDYSKKIEEAVSSTEGMYVSYNDEVALTFFFSTSTGMTENCHEVFVQNLPYLTSVESSWDEKISPVFSEIHNYSKEEFYEKLNHIYNENININIKETTSTGRVKIITINNIDYEAEDIYKQLGLRSTYFSINYDNNNIVITTKGYGHGVGMSQYGAYGMANEGYTYEEILKHYYQGIEIKNYNL